MLHTCIDLVLDRSVLVIDDKKLRCAALLTLLESWAKTKNIKVSSCETVIGIDDCCLPHYEMIIFNPGVVGVASPAATSVIQQVRRSAPNASLVIISDDDSATEIVSACKAGSRGFIPTGTDPTFALQALDFILCGGSFFPSTALAQVSKPEIERETAAQIENTGYPGSRQSDKLTSRQREVLVYLREGKSNKVIARELNMQEATVKVHVRQIMRKLGASNRTQAALRAIELSEISFDVEHELPNEVGPGPKNPDVNVSRVSP